MSIRRKIYQDRAAKVLFDEGLANVPAVIVTSKTYQDQLREQHLLQKRNAPVICSGRKWTPDTSYFQKGYARKLRWSTLTKYLAKQLDFLKWAQFRFQKHQSKANGKESSTNYEAGWHRRGC